MIRPVLYVDLPGIIYAIDRRARNKQHEFANFVCWLEPVESRIPLSPILRNIFPVNTASRTWICEDHWHILGFAQVRERPSRVTWDIAYLASMVNSTSPVMRCLLRCSTTCYRSPQTMVFIVFSPELRMKFQNRNYSRKLDFSVMLAN